MDNGPAVARQTRCLTSTLAAGREPGQLVLLSTGNPDALTNAARRWLGVDTPASLPIKALS
jgi:hypothetical protein